MNTTIETWTRAMGYVTRRDVTMLRTSCVQLHKYTRLHTYTRLCTLCNCTHDVRWSRTWRDLGIYRGYISNIHIYIYIYVYISATVISLFTRQTLSRGSNNIFRYYSILQVEKYRKHRVFGRLSYAVYGIGFLVSNGLSN